MKKSKPQKPKKEPNSTKIKLTGRKPVRLNLEELARLEKAATSDDLRDAIPTCRKVRGT